MGRKLLLFFSIFLLLLFAGGLVLIYALDLNDYRDYIITAAEERTGRTISVGEDLHIELFPQPRLVLTDLRLQNASWGSTPDMITAKRLEAQLALWPLITGDVVIRRIGIFDAALRLERNPQGKGNWELAEKQPIDGDESPTRLPNIEELEITGLTLSWQDHSSGVSHRLQASHVELQRQPDTKALKLKFQGEYNGNSLRLSAKITPPNEDAGKTAVEGLQTTFGDSNLRGDLTLQLPSGGKPRLTANLQSDHLYLEDFLGTEEEDRGARDKIFSREPLPTSFLSRWEGVVTFRAGQVSGKRLTINDLDLGIQLKGGVLTANAVTKKEETARFRIDAREQPPAADLTLSLHDLELGNLIRSARDEAMLTSRGDVSIELQGSGGSIAALMADLSGHVRLLAGSGRLSIGRVDTITGGVWNILGTLTAKDSDSTTINCLASDFQVQQGIASSRALLIDSENATVFGKGTIDLRDEKIDFLFKPKPKTATLNTAVPVQVGGTLARPRYTLEKSGMARKALGVVGLFAFPPAALIGLGELGTGEKNPCLQIAAGGTVPEERSGNMVEKGGTAIKETLEGVGGKLKGLLGK